MKRARIACLGSPHSLNACSVSRLRIYVDIWVSRVDTQRQ